MDVSPTKKKIVIKVKPHVISVGQKKPSNGGKGIETPIPAVNLRRPLWKKCLDVIKEDIHLKKVETVALVKDEPSWEEYLRFRELANQGKKE